MTADVNTPPDTGTSAVLDSAHSGEIEGGLGLIRIGDDAPGEKLSTKLRTLLAIVGRGLIVMVGTKDPGPFGTYTQAGHNYGTTLLWTLLGVPSASSTCCY